MSTSTKVATIVIIVLAVVLVFMLLNDHVEVTIVRSNVDGRNYLVQNLPDKQQAADLLGLLSQDLVRQVQHMEREYPDNPAVKRLVRNFDPDRISEAGARDIYTSYSVNKGEKIVLCIRARGDNNALQPKNLLMYVAVHELAHLMTKETGHTPRFWENNKLLLREAVRIGIYERIDFDKEPAKYCGIKISTSII